MSDYHYFQKYKQKYFAVGGSTLQREYETDDLYRLGKAYKNAYKLMVGGGNPKNYPLDLDKKMSGDAKKAAVGDWNTMKLDKKTQIEGIKAMQKYAKDLETALGEAAKSAEKGKGCFVKLRDLTSKGDCKDNLTDKAKSIAPAVATAIQKLQKDIEAAAK